MRIPVPMTKDITPDNGVISTAFVIEPKNAKKQSDDLRVVWYNEGKNSIFNLIIILL